MKIEKFFARKYNARVPSIEFPLSYYQIPLGLQHKIKDSILASPSNLKMPTGLTCCTVALKPITNAITFHSIQLARSRH